MNAWKLAVALVAIAGLAGCEGVKESVGGALGNVIDRIMYGAVADFFHFHAFGRDWYVFNVADAAITVGVVALLADAFRRPKPGVKP